MRGHLLEMVTETELTGRSQGVFSWSFKRDGGAALVGYRNQMRIKLAWQMPYSNLRATFVANQKILMVN